MCRMNLSYMSKAIGDMHNNLCRLFSMYSSRIGLQMHDNVGVVDQKRSAVNAAFHSSYGSHLFGTALHCCTANNKGVVE